MGTTFKLKNRMGVYILKRILIFARKYRVSRSYFFNVNTTLAKIWGKKEASTFTCKKCILRNFFTNKNV